MLASRPANPFDDQLLEEIVLSRAPLVRVLAQVRLPGVVSMLPGRYNETATQVMTELQDAYGVVEQHHEAVFTLSPTGVEAQQGPSIWRARSADRRWLLTIAPNFVALETSAYTVRQDFMERFVEVLRVVESVIRPPEVERIGLRYTNRIESSEHVKSVGQLLQPEALGGLLTPRPPGVALVHLMTEALYRSAPDRMVHLRSGLVPGNSAFDPDIPALDKPSWILDLDSFTTERAPFDVQTLGHVSTELALAAYRYFRWLITDEFIEQFRGESE